MIDHIIPKSECTGCKMCADLCPTQAIGFQTDDAGFWYPKVDGNKCITCRLCVNKCPIIGKRTPIERLQEQLIYEAHHKDVGIKSKSTSGGAFYALAETIIEMEGAVAGCTYSGDFKSAHHVITYDMQGLEPLIGSKYFQDDTAGIYQAVKQELERHRPVLFAGAPCQVAGLYQYLGNNNENLYTTSFICKGINSPKAYRAYLDELEQKYKSSVKYVHFKNKKQGWTNLGVLIEFENGKSDYTNKKNNPFINGYVNGNLYIRDCCHHCKFKSLPLVSDITYGDFWGIKTSQENLKNGMSIILINSAKGQTLFKLSKANMIYKQHEQFNINTNRCVVASTPKNEPGYTAFFSRISTEPFSQVVWSILGTTAFRQQLKFHLFNIKRKLKLLLGFKDHL